LDFALILVVATGATGLIWLFDLVLLKRRRLARAAAGEPARESIVVEYARSFFPVLLLVLLLRSFLFEPFRIPSASMMPTLLEGDFIFVNKYTYGLRLPVLNSKIVEIGEPERGDVVVFRLPSEPSVNYIKRVVGLPGDVVEYDPREKRIAINGERVDIELVGEHFDRIQYDVGREMLGEHDHEVMLARHSQSLGGRYVVPEGHYFMMGDNRDNSKDSRYEGVEFIPEDHLVGRAVRIWLSWRAPSEGGPRWSRIGQGID
jgi:signal peptidase I